MKKAVILLSGGLDSAVTLYLAKKQRYKCHCLIFDYGQRHTREIQSARKIANIARCDYKVLKISLPWRGSSLLDKRRKIPQRNNAIMQQRNNAVPSTYVPARNMIFLSFAVSFAEAIGAKAVFIGANAIDFSGYPDCRPEFYAIFNKIIKKGTKNGNIRIKIPLIHKKKSEIVKIGKILGVPFDLTWSCYKGGRRPCGVCDACRFRQMGFKEAGLRSLALNRNGSGLA